ncbi:MAG TPA: hypothetical protein VF681_03295 [Abditibacteriaceae bacterium]
MSNLNRWDDSTKPSRKSGGIAHAGGVLAKFLSLPRGVQIALAIAAVVVVFGLVGTVFGWIFSLLALIGRVLIFSLIALFIWSQIQKRK